MGWRRFSVLLRCMSPNSALVNHIGSQHEFGGSKGKREPVTKVEGAKAAQSTFVSLFGGGSKAGKPRR